MGFAEVDLRGLSSSLLESRVSLILARVRDFLTEQKVQSYIVGGLVRDVMLGRETADIDIVVASDGPTIARKVADTLGGKYVLLDKISRVGRVVLVDKAMPSPRAQWCIDFSTFEGSIEQDLKQRDFTINAMAVDLGRLRQDMASIQLVDPFNGLVDLRQRVVRAVTGTAFESDAVRLMRAVRLAAELGFTIDRQTEALITRCSYLITDVAGERVRQELLGLLAVSNAGQVLTYLDELNLLTAVFPELAGTRDIQQPKEHFWNVFDHSLKTISAVDFLLRQGTWETHSQEVLDAVPWSATLAHHINLEVSRGSTRGLLLKLAALLHDIAKPQTKTVDAGGRMRFLGHAKEGAIIVANILERLRFSTRETKLVETMVRYHLRPGQMSQNELPTRRAIYRYFRDCGQAGIDILFLCLADHLATRGPHLDLSRWREHARMTEYVLSQHSEQERVTRPAKLVDGHDLISIFNMRPGPEIGEILEAVREAQASGEVATRQQALAYVGDCLLTKVE